MKQKRIDILMRLRYFTLLALNAINERQFQIKLKYDNPATNWMTSALIRYLMEYFSAVFQQRNPI